MAQDSDHDRPDHLVRLDSGWGIWRLGVLRSAGLPLSLLDRFAVTGELDRSPGPERDAAVRRIDMDAVNAALADDTLVSAMTWQNPKAVRDWVAAHRTALRAGPTAFTARRRDTRSSAVARYAQRYCAKNESIGFFGPVAWARFDDGPTRITGSGELIRRTISYEVWALKAVAQAWNEDPELLPHLPVRLDPACAPDGDTVRRPHRPPVRLDEAAARLVERLGEAGSVGELADLVGRPPAETFAGLKTLHDQRIVQLGFLVPLHERPEELLRAQVRQVPDDRVAKRLLDRLDRLDRARAVLTAAADPDALLAALAGIDHALAEAAGEAGPGQDAAPREHARFGRRTPVYHDCRRDLDATIGPAELDDLAGPLGLLLDSASWLARQVGEAVEEGLLERYRSLAATRGRVTLSELQFAAADLLSGGGPGVAEAVTDFQLRWAEILDPAGAADDVLTVDAGRARALADALFPGGTPRWSAARLHSPDVMIADTPAGPRWVIGELHVAVNTMESRLFATQADDRNELVESVRADWPGGRVVPVYPTDGALVSSRTYPPPALDPPGLFHYWSYGTDDGHPSGASSTPAAAMVVLEQDGELVAGAGDAGWTAPVLECFGEFVSALAADLFQILPPAERTPRVVIGDVTVARASWRFALADVPAGATRAKDVGHDRLRAWAAAQGMPRHVFVRTPLERKPFYVDWHAPLLVENLGRLVRKMRAEGTGGWIKVAEMLPAPDQLWLTDPHGRRFTSELRLVAVDPAPAPDVLRPPR
ncbi:lantibiotic dehydratase [Kitasatospora sp. NPDC127059]|uniref:lantibiotic dehydratase n=1 Tax=unclassified Kitasatospora TaxID=2633591 RepID=UPI00365965BA